jgi:nicotinamide-nucleotide amidase
MMPRELPGGLPIDDDRPIRAGMLSVGSELLLGDLTDTNATWLSRRLTALGIEVVHHLAARDILEELVEALHWLVDRVDVVVVGGGLGPTGDDLTRESIAAATGAPLERHPEIEDALRARFQAMGRDMPERNLKQAMIPRGATVYPAVGTAPAFGLTIADPSPTRVFALPGVPWELKDLFDAHVTSELRALVGARATVTRLIHVAGLGESTVSEIVEPLIDDPAVTLAFLAHARTVEVRLTISADDPDAAQIASQPLVDKVAEALGTAVVSIDDETLEEVVVRLLAERGQTVATAESATAGDVAGRLGRVPGASRVLVGGMVVYADEAKRDLLDTPAGLLEAEGPVSDPVTAHLAVAVRERLGADYGIAVTGVAGPDPVGDLEVGTAIWALAGPDGKIEVHRRRLPGDRTQVIARLGTAALDLLRQRLLER